MVETPSDVGIGLEVEHPITSAHGLCQDGRIEDIAFDPPETRSTPKTTKELQAPGAKIIKYDNLASCFIKSVGQMATDETGPAGDARSPG
jgi:hypothetical protein